MAGTFTYYAYDLRTMKVKAELPFRGGVTFGRILNDSGDFNGEIDLEQVAESMDVVDATTPSKTLLCIDLDGTLVWCGIIWTRDYDQAEKKITCTGKEIWSYFERLQQLDYTTAPTLGEYWAGNPATAIEICEQFIYDRAYATGVGVSGPVLVGTGGGATGSLNHGTNYTSIPLNNQFLNCPAPNALPSGSVLYLVYNNGDIQTLTTTAPVSEGDTSISVASFSPLVTIDGTPKWLPFSQTTPFTCAYIVPAQGWPPQMVLETAIDQTYVTQGTISPTFPKQQRQTVEALVRQHATTGIGTGFDFSVDAAWLFGPGGPITLTCTFYFPVKGASQYVLGIGLNGRMVDLGAALNFKWSEDGSTQATKVYAVGQATAYLEQDVSSSHALGAGYPLLEQLFPFIMVNSDDELLAAAEGELSLDAFPVAAPKVTLPAFGNEPVLGEFVLGDTMRVFMAAPSTPTLRFPTGLEAQMRVIEWEVTVPDEGIPTMDLTFNIPPVIDPPQPVSLGL